MIDVEGRYEVEGADEGSADVDGSEEGHPTPNSKLESSLNLS